MFLNKKREAGTPAEVLAEASAHARLGPSNHRWPNCPASVEAEARYPDVAGEAAIDGTGSHLLLELCLNNGVQAETYIGEVIGVGDRERPNGWLVDAERADRVQMCLNYVHRRVHELSKQWPKSKIKVEAESKSYPQMLVGRTDWWGTVDITITCTDHESDVVLFLEVVDYKDGRGWVHVKDNTQLVSYLAGKLLLYIGHGEKKSLPHDMSKVKHCRYTIVQPKTNPVIRYECSQRDDHFNPQYVMDLASEMGRAAFLTDKKDAPFKAGKWCQWCKANPKKGGHCTAQIEEKQKVIMNMKDDEFFGDDLPAENMQLFEQAKAIVKDPKAMSDNQLSEFLSAEDALAAAFKACKAEIQSRIEQGIEVDGWEMAAGRTTRVWNLSEDEMVKKLKGRKLKLDTIYPKKLASPAQILKDTSISKAQRDRIEKDFVTDVAGKLTLKKCAHKSKKDVAQDETSVLQSTQEMFKGVGNEPSNAVTKQISFLKRG